MISDEIGQQLHDKETRGAPLTREERAQLKKWYGQQDAAENTRLLGKKGGNAVEALRNQVNEGLEQIKKMAQEIQDLAKVNEGLRQEVGVLRERAGRRKAPRAA